MSFYEKLEILMNKADISQGKLEKAIGIANGSVNKWKKSNATPRYETIKKLSDFFNVSIDYFTGDEEEPYADEKAHMFARIVRNVELSNALEKYFRLSDKKRKHVLELIDLLSEK